MMRLIIIVVSLLLVAGLADSSTTARPPPKRSITVTFDGNAEATAHIPASNGTMAATSLSSFFASKEADSVLIGGAQSTYNRYDDTWEAKQTTIKFLGLELTPIFRNRLVKSPFEKKVTVSVLDSTTHASEGRIGTTLANLMKKSRINALTTIRWVQEDDGSYRLMGSLQMSIDADIPTYLPLPPGFDAIGSK
ncbi:hypothetical protein THAOC_05623, partial [Thalassiosira oceanica]